MPCKGWIEVQKDRHSGTIRWSADKSLLQAAGYIAVGQIC